MIDITSRGLVRDPDFLYAALDTTACAAFIKESRIGIRAMHPLALTPVTGITVKPVLSAYSLHD